MGSARQVITSMKPNNLNWETRRKPYSTKGKAMECLVTHTQQDDCTRESGVEMWTTVLNAGLCAGIGYIKEIAQMPEKKTEIVSPK